MPTAKKRLATATPNSPAGPRATMDQGMSDERRAAREAIALEARDALIVLRQRNQLGVADHIVDASEGPVAAALPDFAQDRIRRACAIHEDQLIRRLEPCVF